jgi:hypothetical protein
MNGKASSLRFLWIQLCLNLHCLELLAYAEIGFSMALIRSTGPSTEANSSEDEKYRAGQLRPEERTP